MTTSASSDSSALAAYRRGLLLTLLGALVLVPDTLLIRLSGMDSLPLLAWRGLLGSVTLLLWWRLTGGGRWVDLPRAIGAAGVGFALCYAASTVLFVSAVAETTVTSVVVVLATVPLVAALLSRLWLKERLSPATARTIVLAMIGLGLVSLGDLSSDRGAGFALALGAALLIGGYLTILRAFPGRIAIAPATALALVFSGLIGLGSAGLPLPEGPWQALWIGLNAVVVVPVSFVLLLNGPSLLPAAEVGLVMLLETVLAPLLVWAVLGEFPGWAAVAGGLVVIAALATHALAGLRRRPTAGEGPIPPAAGHFADPPATSP